MSLYQLQYQDVLKLLEYKEYPMVTKRIIDFALDTQNTACYQQTVELLDWLDKNPDNIEEKDIRFREILQSINNILSTKHEVNKKNNVLSIKQVIKRYTNSNFRLGPISLHMREGQILGLVGENGNGKTTLLRLLCGELAPTMGEITYSYPFQDGYDMRSHLIYIPQRTDSWSGSLYTNLQFAATCYGITGEDNELIVELIIARMGLRKFRTYKWKDLSSGYKMRFELARALLRNPQILLIDEPLANLDILAQQTVLDDLKAIAGSAFRPIAIILSSQQLYEVEKTSDNVIFLKEGIPQNLKENNDNEEQSEDTNTLIIEFETSCDQETLRNTLAAIQNTQLQINGGTYIGHFPGNISQEDFLRITLDNNISISYFRNISKSTRRFFIS